MITNLKAKIVKERRDYNSWVATETLEDYALRFAPKSFRKWSAFSIANTALGGISFLALEAIGGSIAINYGFTNSFWAILVVGLIIFLAGLPICYYASKYNIDMDLLTRGAGFGYIGSTITSLIYASFTFIFFALEAAIMAQALELYFQLPLAWGYLLCSLIIIPLVFFGVTLINQLQWWTQPLWLTLMISPYIFVLYKEPESFSNWLNFAGKSVSGTAFDPLIFGVAATVSFSLIAQLGEQVDYLRFLPEKQQHNRLQWWLAVIIAGPGWIFLGVAKQLGGAFLASLAISQGVSFEKAKEPVQMYLAGFEYVFSNPEIVLAVTIIFVIISQIKINVTNAYAGSLAWSNFFSRITHSHPGRVVWLVFNIAIALVLMELGVFETLEAVLGLYSNVAIAWVGALVADLVINKPLGISPSYIEFKRAYLYNINPVGFGSMLIASAVAILSFVGVFGDVAKAFSPFIALGLAIILSPIIAYATKGKYYIARKNTILSQIPANSLVSCCICEIEYEREDMAFCPVYDGNICSLCCSLDARCHDACKKSGNQKTSIFRESARVIFKDKLSPELGARILRYLTAFLSLSGLVGSAFGLVYYQQILSVEVASPLFFKLRTVFIELYALLIVLIAIGAWGLVLNEESRQLAQEELDKQNLQLQQEIRERLQAEKTLRETEAQLIQSEKMAALGGLAAGISHEINTPIGIGITAASLLNEKVELLTEKYGEGKMKRSDLETFLKTANETSLMLSGNLERAAELVRSFKQISLDQSNEELRLINVKTYLQEILFHLTPELKRSKHFIKVEGDDNLCLETYAGALSQIVTNLVMNSLLHGYEPEEEGILLIQFAQEGNSFVLEYSDNGKGIPEAHLSKVFDPFFTTKRGQGGSGLGLNIVYNLVTQKLNGTIKCETEVGLGTKFIVTIPNAKVLASVNSETN